MWMLEKKQIKEVYYTASEISGVRRKDFLWGRGPWVGIQLQLPPSRGQEWHGRLCALTRGALGIRKGIKGRNQWPIWAPHGRTFRFELAGTDHHGEVPPRNTVVAADVQVWLCQNFLWRWENSDSWGQASRTESDAGDAAQGHAFLESSLRDSDV